MQNIFIYFANAFITLYFYIHLYFWHFILLILCLIAAVVEFRSKEFLYIDDQRKVV